MRVMMAQLAVPIRLVPRLLHRARSDSLVRNSLYLMASTVVTAGLGYVFWIIAAHAFTSQEVGVGGAVISLCSTVALLTYLGSSATLIERLPVSERSSVWTIVLVRVCVATAGVTVVATAAAVLALLASKFYRTFFTTASPILVAVVGAAAWTLVNLFGAAFIASRRAGRPAPARPAWWEHGLPAPSSALALEPYGSSPGWGSDAGLATARAGGRLSRPMAARARIGALVIDDLMPRLARSLYAGCWVST